MCPKVSDMFDLKDPTFNQRLDSEFILGQKLFYNKKDKLRDNTVSILAGSNK